MKKVKFGVIGYGQRGSGMTQRILLGMSDVEVIGVCDYYQDRTEQAMDDVEKACGKRPFGSTNYMDILNMKSLDAVMIATSWETHVPFAIEAMNKGIAVAMEVCGAYNIDSLWELVRTQERTGTPFMFMENCCFGKTELLGTSFVRNGLLGELVHAHGAYAHHLAYEIATGEKHRHYRLRNYLLRNCDNYPTHELGPIAKALNINRGNQMLSLVSIGSKAVGMADYVNRYAEKYPDLVGKTWRQSDIVNTLITCADGSTISLRLDTTLPRSYSREFTLRGTNGLYEQDTNLLYRWGDREYWDTERYYRDMAGNAAKLEEDYLPDIWKTITQAELDAGHGGMDGLEMRAFVNALKANKEMPIDVYDAAAWMSISALSEISIAQGGAPQMIPDFTNGMWTVRKSKDVVDLPIVNK